MTMAFAIVSLTRGQHRPGHAPRTPGAWSSPVFPYLGWIILGWILTWAAVELNMLQRLLDTTSLSGREWIIVLALSLLAPAVVAVEQGHPAAAAEQRTHRGQPYATAHWLGVQTWRIKFTFPGRHLARPVSRPAGEAQRSSG